MEWKLFAVLAAAILLAVPAYAIAASESADSQAVMPTTASTSEALAVGKQAPAAKEKLDEENVKKINECTKIIKEYAQKVEACQGFVKEKLERSNWDGEKRVNKTEIAALVSQIHQITNQTNAEVKKMVDETAAKNKEIKKNAAEQIKAGANKTAVIPSAHAQIVQNRNETAEAVKAVRQNSKEEKQKMIDDIKNSWGNANALWRIW